MRQPTLARFLSAPAPAPASGSALRVYDLFCGGGGFSCGAALAGCRVVFACDADETALLQHEVNHPEAEHWRCTLPRDDLPLPPPTATEPWHLHGSPPCQMLSKARTVVPEDDAGAAVRGAAEGLVEWYLALALRSGATSWSMEQVPTKRLLAIVERARVAHPTRLAYGVFDLSLLGVPQTRTRLVAGSPALIERLHARCSARNRRSIRDAIPRTRGTHLRAGKNWVRRRTRGGTFAHDPAGYYDYARSVDGLAPTLLCNGDLRWTWLEPDGRTGRAHITMAEFAALQTFPASYRFPRRVQSARRLIGNAVPPALAKALLAS